MSISICVVYSNRGMYAETLVNRTISYLKNNNKCFIEKRNIPLQIIKSLGEGLVMCKIISESSIDYFGHMDGEHIEFEVKETREDHFPMNLLKHHQLNHVGVLLKNKVNVFIIIYFHKYNEFYAIDFLTLFSIIKNNKKNILTIDQFKQSGCKLNIIFPGVLDLYEYIVRKIIR